MFGLVLSTRFQYRILIFSFTEKELDIDVSFVPQLDLMMKIKKRKNKLHCLLWVYCTLSMLETSENSLNVF